MADVWVLMADANVALDEIRSAAKHYAEPPGSDRLIDRAPHADDPPAAAKPQRQRALPAACACPVGRGPVDHPSVFAMVAEDEDRLPADVQWATMTLLAINAAFRERVASASPAPAARLVREMPARFERYLMGTSTSSTMTPYEAVCDFTGRVQLAYAGVAEHVHPINALAKSMRA